MKLAAEVRACVAGDFDFGDRAHDIQHLDRVARLAETLAESEGADSATVIVAAYLHDYHRVAEFANGLKPATSEELADLLQGALARVRTIVDVDPDVVRECVAYSDRYAFGIEGLPERASLEARVVRDADNLDALGAIGVARAFAYGSLLGQPFFSPGAELAAHYSSGATSSVVSHFGEKLLRLKDDMETAAGRKLAGVRHDYMVEFLAAVHEDAGESPPSWLARFQNSE